MSERSNLLDQINVEETGSLARVRGFVLDLAVRGRLLPQLSAEGSGSSLVAGLRGVDRKRDPANEQEPPFDLPASWTWSTVGGVSSYVQRGKGPDYAEASAVPVVSQKCVQWEGFLIERARFIDPKSLCAYGEERLLRDGDLLWNSTGHGTVGRVAVFRSDPRYPHVVADSHVTIVRPEIEARFLWCWLASPTVQRTIDDLVSGTTKQTELSTSTVVGHPVPVPPVAEQKRIVAKVDQLMALCDDLEARQTKKRDTSTRLTKSALQALTTAEGPEEFDLAWKRVVENFDVLIDRSEKVGELRGAILSLAMRGALLGATVGPDRGDGPYPLPPHWAWRRLADVVASITDGDHQPPPRAPSGIAFLTIGNVSGGRLDFTETRFVPRSYFEDLDPRRVPADGDILYTVVGATYGRPVRVENAPPFCVQRHIAIVRPNDSCERDYLFWFLRSPLGYGQATASITGTAQPTVALGPLRRFLVPVPPLAEQRRLTAIVEKFMATCDELEARLTRAEDRAANLVEAVVQDLVA